MSDVTRRGCRWPSEFRRRPVVRPALKRVVSRKKFFPFETLLRHRVSRAARRIKCDERPDFRTSIHVRKMWFCSHVEVTRGSTPETNGFTAAIWTVRPSGRIGQSGADILFVTTGNTETTVRLWVRCISESRFHSPAAGAHLIAVERPVLLLIGQIGHECRGTFRWPGCHDSLTIGQPPLRCDGVKARCVCHILLS